MNIDLCPTAKDIKNFQILDCTVIVIDVLRATSCIITALANGCSAAIPVYTPQEALNYRKLYADKVFLGGERNSTKLNGFDVGNSPREYLTRKIKGKKLVITTTNGTRAVKEAAKAKKLLVGSILNARVTAKKALALQNPVLIICSGTKDVFSLEDFLAAGLIVSELKKSTSLELSDLALTAELTYDCFKSDILKGLKSTKHGHQLINMGLGEDLEFCSQVNWYPIVAEYENEEIVIASKLK